MLGRANGQRARNVIAFAYTTHIRVDYIHSCVHTYIMYTLSMWCYLGKCAIGIPLKFSAKRHMRAFYCLLRTLWLYPPVEYVHVWRVYSILYTICISAGEKKTFHQNHSHGQYSVHTCVQQRQMYIFVFALLLVRIKNDYCVQTLPLRFRHWTRNVLVCVLCILLWYTMRITGWCRRPVGGVLDDPYWAMCIRGMWCAGPGTTFSLAHTHIWVHTHTPVVVVVVVDNKIHTTPVHPTQHTHAHIQKHMNTHAIMHLRLETERIGVVVCAIDAMHMRWALI